MKNSTVFAFVAIITLLAGCGTEWSYYEPRLACGVGTQQEGSTCVAWKDQYAPLTNCISQADRANFPKDTILVVPYRVTSLIDGDAERPKFRAQLTILYWGAQDLHITTGVTAAGFSQEELGNALALSVWTDWSKGPFQPYAGWDEHHNRLSNQRTPGDGDSQFATSVSLPEDSGLLVPSEIALDIAVTLDNGVARTRELKLPGFAITPTNGSVLWACDVPMETKVFHR